MSPQAQTPADRRRRRKEWPDEYVIVRLLRELFDLNVRKEFATLHQLSTLRGMPIQRDERIKRLLEILLNQGLVSKNLVGERTIYFLSEKGANVWLRHRDGFDIFRPLHEADANP
ncbi:hypothetical protein E6H18_04680 [Candidatus Bathyarchaeota archaeon]|nr:MAG: hypothetical protein E6H18_04680 [Candidatus Bathyarchaeota archaeon]